MKQLVLILTADNEQELVELLNFTASRSTYTALDRLGFFITFRGHVILKLIDEKENPNMKLLRLIEE